MIGKETYINEVIPQVPRLLTVLDRNEHSPTFGSFYRIFWHDKVTDIASAHPQIGVFSLALLYKHNFPGNIYFKNEKMKKYCIAGMNYWSKIQNSDGSFNEHYPNEHSFGATAWSLGAVLDSYLLLEKEIPNSDKKAILDAALKACKWLVKNDDPGPLTNHIAISAMALYNMFKVTNKKIFLKDSLEKIGKALKNQSPEGWFLEYDGADLGYLTTTISFLSRYYLRTKNKDLLDALKKAILFSSYFVYPDSSYGGFIGSRHTSHFHPSGFEIMCKKIPIADAITRKLLKGIKDGNILTPKVMDDKHFFHLMNEFLQSYIHFSSKSNVKQKLPYEYKSFEKHFEDAGLFVVKEPSYYAVIALNKGGVVKIFDAKKSRLVLNDGGFHGLTDDDNLISSHWLDKKYSIEIKNRTISVGGRFHKVRLETLPSAKMIISRLGLLTLGRSNKVSFVIKKGLIKRLITGSKRATLKFRRELKFSSKQIQIKDMVEGGGLKSINIGGNLSPRFVPASRYFSKSNLKTKDVWQASLAKKLNRSGKVVVKRNINF